MEGWVDHRCPALTTPRPGTESMTAWSKVRRPNRCAMKTPMIMIMGLQAAIHEVGCDCMMLTSYGVKSWQLRTALGAASAAEINEMGVSVLTVNHPRRRSAPRWIFISWSTNRRRESGRWRQRRDTCATAACANIYKTWTKTHLTSR